MIPLYSETQLQKAKYTDKLPLQCEFCKKQFLMDKKYILKALKPNTNVKCRCCSKQCAYQLKIYESTVMLNCEQCGKPTRRTNSTVSKHNFCSQSCGAVYNNAHKTHGYRRAKLEIWLANKLAITYPILLFLFNNKSTINSELDIYIPSLKLAFELNGISHYEPIYGVDKLNNIKNNDNRKIQACLEQEIELYIINTSSQKRFTEQSSHKFLDIIYSIINAKITKAI